MNTSYEQPLLSGGDKKTDPHEKLLQKKIINAVVFTLPAIRHHLIISTHHLDEVPLLSYIQDSRCFTLLLLLIIVVYTTYISIIAKTLSTCCVCTMHIYIYM